MSIKSISIMGFLVTIMLMTGCAGVGAALEQTSDWRNRAQSVKEESQGALDQLITQRDGVDNGSVIAAELDALIAQTKLKVQLLESAITNADIVLNEAQNPRDGITTGTRMLLPFLPAPAQAPALLGAALIATLLRSTQLKSGTRSIIQSIQHTMKNDDAFRVAFQSNADSIRTIQTPLARKMVDRVQRA